MATKEKRKLKDLNLLDKFLFDEAMEDKENMKTLLDIILGQDTKLKLVSTELVELLEYMEKSTDTVAKECESERIHQMHERVNRLKSDKEMEIKYMQKWEEKEIDRQEAYAEGERIGEARGREEGERIGEERGREEGERIGEERGREKGERIGENRINRLIMHLIEQGRNEDLARAASDPEYQAKLLKEFGL